MLSDLGSNQDSSPPKGDVLPVTPSDNLRCPFVKKERKDKNYYYYRGKKVKSLCNSVLLCEPPCNRENSYTEKSYSLKMALPTLTILLPSSMAIL